MFELQNNQIVALRNGMVGYVASFNDKPELIVFSKYTNPISQYNADLTKENSQYDVVAVYDGSSITDVKSVFGRGFNVSELPLVWARETTEAVTA